MTLARALDVSMSRTPDAVAIVDGDRRLTYGVWGARVHRVARALALRGVGAGDHVVLSLKNREEHATMYWACQMLGAVATPLNWRYSPGELEYCVADADGAVVVFEGASRDAALAARERLPGVGTWIAVGCEASGAAPFESLAAGVDDPGAPKRGGSDADLSIMLYTSGTTGRPKGVPRTHRAELAAALAHVVQGRNTFADVTLGVMPLYHTMGVRSMIAMALLSGRLVCLADWNPAAAARLLEAERVTSLYLVPTLYHDLLASPELGRRDVSTVKKLGYAGAPMSSTLTKQVAEAFHPDVFLNHLGSTEIYTFTVCDRIVQKPTCAGRPGLFARVRVVTPDPDRRGRPDAVVPRGETGELIVGLDSPEAFAGYWRRPDADEKAIRDGWYFTGDLVYEDEDGDLYTVGRVDDMIISGGENVHPVEVEEVLLRHPAVAEACVIGLPDARLGQVVAAFVVTREALTADALDAFCRRAPDFASFKRPRRYEFVTSVPKSPTGKLLRRRLIEEQTPGRTRHETEHAP
jgi:2-furoate---CoA ligase